MKREAYCVREEARVEEPGLDGPRLSALCITLASDVVPDGLKPKQKTRRLSVLWVSKEL